MMKDPDLLPSDNDQLLAALLAEGLSLEMAMQMVETKVALDQIPAAARVQHKA